ncbi:MAG TPA: glutathione S-transferase N-terminal domain-containing protein [Steroidobacteraceae bacterium]|nr:glutathione S-transferase N-terminal domain-containing protein [Steroidobacteraceae bacterium]
MNAQFKPVAYVKEGCPYSMKFMNFIEDADLADELEVVWCAPGTHKMEAVREKLTAATGEPAQFPTVEVEPGDYRTESKQLIQYFSEHYNS